MPGLGLGRSLVGFPLLGLLLRLVGVVLLVAVLLLGFVLGTQTGLRMAVAVAEELAPERIRVGRVEGRVLGELTLGDLRLELPSLSLALGRLHLDWQPGALLTGRLRIADLSAADIDIVAVPAEPDKPPPEPFALPEIRLPIALDIDRVLVERLSFRQAGAPEASAVRLTRAELSATAVSDRVELRRLAAELAQPEATATVTGGVRLTGDYPLDLALDWRFQQPPGLALTGTGSVGGTLAALQVHHRVDGAVALTLDASVHDLLSGPSWQGELHLERLDLQALVPDAPPVDLIARLETSGNLDGASVTGTLSGAASNRADLGQLSAALDLSWAGARLRLHSLRIDEALSGATLDLEGHADLSGATPSFDIRGAWERLRWPLAGEAMVEAPQGKLEATGDPGAFDYGLSADLFGAEIPELRLTLAGTGNSAATRIDQLLAETLGGRIEAKGTAAWAPAVTWDLAVTAADLDPGRRYAGLDGRIGFQLGSAGGLEDGFDFQLRGSAAVAGYPPAVVAIGGKGTGEAAVLETLQINLLDGRIDGTGRVAWAPELSWSAALRLAGLNPGSLLADWPGRLGGQVQSQGRMTEQGPDLSARIGELSGELRGYQVRLTAALGMQGQAIRLDDLTAGSGATRLTAGGVLAGEQLDFRFGLDSPDLAELIPGGAGSLGASGSLGGTLAAPRLRLRFKGRDAEVSGQGVAAIDGSLDLGLGEGSDVAIDITGRGLVAGGQRFEALSVKASGRMDRHSLRASLDGDVLGLALALDGGLSRSFGGPSFDYLGSLGELAIATEELGTWRLQRPATLAFAAGTARVGPVCLGNGAESGGCARFEQPEPGRFEASLDIPRIGFDILDPLLPQLLVMEGYLQAQGRFRGEGNRLAGSARLAVPRGAIQLALDDESKDRLVFSGTGLDLRAGRDSLDARFDLPLAGLGGVRAALTLPAFRLDAGASQQLRGDLGLELTGLSRISNLFPDIDEVTGSIDGDLRLAGTLGAPDLRGELRVQELGLRVPLYGTQVSAANLTIASRGRSDFDITGRARVGGGGLELSGSLDLAGAAPVVQIDMQGKDLRVADSSEYFALLSLDMDIGAGAGGTAVRGEIALPEARIKPRSVPVGAVQPSPDVVLEEPGEDMQPLPLSIDVLVRLGTEVSIDAFGLRGLMRGRLRVTKAPRSDQILGNGQLKIVDGTYRVTLPTLGVLTAIGKPLTIEQGILSFANTPVTNPGLILNAKREGGDITAGVRVLGSLRDPKLAFFSDSDPNLTQSEITKYLVTGIPPTRDAEADSRALAVGTYVAPKIYMEYESATSDTAQTVKMRYDLSNRIELQAETGDTQGADIFFTFEN